MHLDTEFYRLPLHCDVERLREEVAAFAEDDWRPHPQGFAGNSAMILVSANGDQNDDMYGPMQPTDRLARCPYIRQILASLDTVIGRSRLMRIGPQTNVPAHCDINYYWRDRMRIHIPIITDPDIRFQCNDRQVHMGPGEVWVFDNWRTHAVFNPTEITRVHLVADTTGSSAFWELLEQSERPFDPARSVRREPRPIPYQPGIEAEFPTERYNIPRVMHPAEMDLLLGELARYVEHADSAADSRQAFISVLDWLRRDWRCTWAVHGEAADGVAAYQALIERAFAEAGAIAEPLPLPANGSAAFEVLRSRLAAALHPELRAAAGAKPAQPRAAPPRAVASASTPRNISRHIPAFDRPLFIVAAPRSGSTLLYETLAENRGLWSLGGEGHEIEALPGLHPRDQGWHSNQLPAAAASPEIVQQLKRTYLKRLQTPDGVLYAGLPAAQRPESIRFLEKTPKNALRIPFLAAAFPDARFIFLHREPRANISSIMDAWASGRFVTYPDLPGWQGSPWSLLLPPGWQRLNGAAPAQIAALQWLATNQQILDDLADLPRARWQALSYEALLAEPATVVQELCDFAGLPFGPRMVEVTAQPLRNSRYTLSAPDPDKWKKHAAAIESVLPEVEPVAAQLRALTTSAAEPAPDPGRLTGLAMN